MKCTSVGTSRVQMAASSLVNQCLPNIGGWCFLMAELKGSLCRLCDERRGRAGVPVACTLWERRRDREMPNMLHNLDSLQWLCIFHMSWSVSFFGKELACVGGGGWGRWWVETVVESWV